MAVTLSLSITQNSQNIANNTSNVTVKVTAKCTYGSWNATGQCNGFIIIDGTKYSFSGIKFNTSALTNWTGTIMTQTVDVSHNEDGTKTLECSASFNTYISAGTRKASGSQVLTTIARASQPSLVTWPESTANVGNFGETFSIHMNRKSDVFTHTVRYAYGDRSGTIATGVETGTTWKVPLDFINDIPSATSASGLIYVDTYNGGTLIGTKYTGFTVTVPASVKPTCTAQLEDVNGVDDIYGSPVAGLSKIKVTVTATEAYGSPIDSYAISIDGAKYTAAEVTTGLLKNEGDSVVKVTVTDKRGRTSTAWTYTMRVQGYTPPKITQIAVRRCDQDGTTNDQGQYIKVTFSATVDGMDGRNTAAYLLQYKKSSESSWTDKAFSELSNVYAATNKTFIFAAEESSSYDIKLTVTDRHNTAKPTTRTTSASTAFSIMDFHPSGTGIRFGGVAELENTFQNDLDLRQVGNSYAFQPGAFNGAKGYTLLAIITLNTLNVNAPIVFEINKRGALCPMLVYVRFASSSTTTDPDLGSISYEGDNLGAFLVKTAPSIWKLYVDNTDGWSNPCLQKWYTTDNQKTRLSVTFMDEQIDGTAPSVLGTYYRATPVKMQSLLDFIYPVGSIYLSFSHVNPGSLFGGTWARIENAFLWAVDADGEIGLKGGAKEVTLTTDQIPKHSHGSVYSQHATGTKDKAWYNTTGTSVAYGPVETGGGQAHNNMPPYIQVSMWRRTA